MSLSHVSSLLQDKGFAVDGGRTLLFASWVDNIFAFAHSHTDAIEILSILEEYLLTNGNLKIGADSKSFLCAAGYHDDELDHDGSAPDSRRQESEVRLKGWSKVGTLNMLGYLLDANGGCSSNFSATKDALWRSFFANAAHSLISRHEAHQYAMIRRSSLPVLRFHATFMNFTPTRAKGLDCIQVSMFRKMLSVRMQPGQTWSEHRRDKDIVAGLKAKVFGRFSVVWAKCLVKWSEHVARSPETFWPRILSTFHDPSWLRAQRLPYVSFHRSLEAGGTATRVLNCAPKVRWDQSITNARAWMVA